MKVTCKGTSEVAGGVAAATIAPVSVQRTLGGGPTGLELPLKGGLALAGRPPGEDTVDADVLVQLGQ